MTYIFLYKAKKHLEKLWRTRVGAIFGGKHGEFPYLYEALSYLLQKGDTE